MSKYFKIVKHWIVQCKYESKICYFDSFKVQYFTIIVKHVVQNRNIYNVF